MKLTSKVPKSALDFIVKTTKTVLKNQGKFQIILFGSYAKGTQTHKSDIDIAIQMESEIPLHLWAKIEEIFEESYLPQKVDVIDFNRVETDFQNHILKTGKVIFPGVAGQKQP